MSAFYAATARFYDAETGDKSDDLRMYSRLAAESVESDGGILDVGCGTGRVLIHLAQAGHAVQGIDSSRAMLDRLAHKLQLMPHLQKLIRYVEADVLCHNERQRFRLILLTYNALMHFEQQAQQLALLRRLHGWLAVGGRLVLDLPNAGPVFATPDSDALIFERSFVEPQSGHLVMLQSVSWLNRTTQVLHVDWIYDEIDGAGAVKRLTAPHRLRYFFLPELRLLLDCCGFAVEAVWGDTEGAPFDEDSERMIVHARRA